MTQPMPAIAIRARTSLGVIEAIRRWRYGKGEHAETQQIAMSAFLIRVVSAACL